jgi:hypothetical protein
MRMKIKIYRQPKKCNENTWIIYSLKEIVFFLIKCASTLILGAMEVDKQVSEKDK